jgi:acetyl/propionyl-CoA carboxylase alpha subunit
VIEEAPAPGLSDDERATLWLHATRLAREISLRGLATVEFLHAAGGAFYFLEINPRLQVEHTVTEEVTGLDLVAIQLELAMGGALPESRPARGHAIQARLYAEDPFQSFLPSPGHFSALDYPKLPRLRIDYGYVASDEFPSHYDPLIAKLIASGPDRDAAIEHVVEGLSQLVVTGVASNRPWVIALLNDPSFRTNRHTLATADAVKVELHAPTPSELRVVAKQVPTEPSPAEAWQASGPFRIVQPATMAFHGSEAGGWQATVALDGDLSYAPYVYVHRSGDKFELVSPDGRWLVTPGPFLRGNDEQRLQDGTLRSPMPGKVLQVSVGVGHVVAEGEVVAVLEAMKIEITLAAPFAGRVAEVHTTAGELVGSRQPIVTITSDSEGPSE